MTIQSPWGTVIPRQQTIKQQIQGFFVFDVPIADNRTREVIISVLTAQNVNGVSAIRWKFQIGQDVVSDFNSAEEALTDAVLWLEHKEHLPLQTYTVVRS